MSPSPRPHACFWILGAALLALAVSGCTGAPDDADAAALTPDIVMKDNVNDPKTFAAAIGVKVVWRNDDPFVHTVTPTDEALWGTDGSGDMQEGDTWSFTFTKAGTYDYYCAWHAYEDDGVWKGQTGTIIVA